MRGLGRSCPVGPGATGDGLLNEPNVRRFAEDWFSCVCGSAPANLGNVCFQPMRKAATSGDELSQRRNKKCCQGPVRGMPTPANQRARLIAGETPSIKTKPKWYVFSRPVSCRLPKSKPAGTGGKQPRLFASRAMPLLQPDPERGLRLRPTDLGRQETGDHSLALYRNSILVARTGR